MSSLYKVEKIVGKRIRQSKYLQYKVKWKGFSSSQCTWEPLKNLNNVKEMISEFELRNKDRLSGLNTTVKTISNDKTTHKNERKSPQSPRVTRSSKITPEDSQIQEKTIKKSFKGSKINKDKVKSKQIIISQPQEEEREEMQEEVKDNSELIDVNIDLLQQKIIEAVQDQKKKPQIIGVLPSQDSKELIYLTENYEGIREQFSKQYIIENLWRELIEFYQGRYEQQLQ